MADPKLKFVLEVDDKGTAVVKSFSGGLDDAGKKTKGFSSELGGLAASAAGAVVKITALGAAAVTAVAGLTIKSAITEYAAFETQLSSLKNVGVTDLGAVKSQILSLPPALGNATEMTAGYYQVLSSGITDAKQSIDSLVTSSQLAKVAHIDQGTAVQAVTSGMKAFKESGDSVADSLMRIEKSGVTTVGQLAPIFGQVSGMASGLNLNLAETSASLAAVTQMSGSTEKGATQLMAIMQELIKPTDAMNDVFAKYGGTVSAIKQIGFEGVLKEIATASGGTAEGIGTLVGSSEALSGLLTLTTDNMGFFNAAMVDQTEKTGSLSSAWTDYQNTLTGVWETAKNAIGEQLILIGEKLAPKIKEVVGDFTAWLEVNQEMIQSEIGEYIDRLVTSIGTVDFDEVVAGAKDFVETLKTIGETIEAIIAPFGWFAEKVEYAAQVWGTWAGGAEIGSTKAADAIRSATTRAGEDIDKLAAKPPVEIKANTDPAVQAVLDLKNQIESGQPAPIKVEADTKPAEKTVEKLEYQIDGKTFTVEVEADTNPASKASADLEKKIGKDKKEIEKPAKMNLETAEAKRAVNDLTGAVEKYETAADEAARKELIIKTEAAQAQVEALTGKIAALEEQLHGLEEQAADTKQALSSVTSSGGSSSGYSVNTGELPLTPGSTASGSIGSYTREPMSESMFNSLTGATRWAYGIQSGMSYSDYVSKYYPHTAATGGYLSGPSHAQGGININAEGGEYIINRRSAAAIGKPTLDAMNAVEYAQGGPVSWLVGNHQNNPNQQHLAAQDQFIVTNFGRDYMLNHAAIEAQQAAHQSVNEAQRAEIYADNAARIAAEMEARSSAQAAFLASIRSGEYAASMASTWENNSWNFQHPGSTMGREWHEQQQAKREMKAYQDFLELNASSVATPMTSNVGYSIGSQQTGAAIANPATAGRSSGGGTYNVTVSPKIMTGDRQSARRMAREMGKSLNDQNRAMGR